MDAPITLADAPPPQAQKTYTAEVLPPNLWEQLTGDLALPVAQLNPEHTVVVVVWVHEPDGSSRVVGRWVAMNTVHLEGLFVDPAYRKNPAVAGHLFMGMIETLRGLNLPEVVTLVEDPAVQALATQAGFQRLPGLPFKLVL